eukprot:SAG31_NODE_1405_length_8488_cov_2.786029_6_plen_188_part_00
MFSFLRAAGLTDIQAFVHELFGDTLALIEPTKSTAVPHDFDNGIYGNNGAGDQPSGNLSGSHIGEGVGDEDDSPADLANGDGLLSLMYSQSRIKLNQSGQVGSPGNIGSRGPETPRAAIPPAVSFTAAGRPTLLSFEPSHGPNRLSAGTAKGDSPRTPRLSDTILAAEMVLNRWQHIRSNAVGLEGR